MSGIPQMLDYPGVKPRGITTEFQKMRFSPLTSFNSYVTNDIVRFWIPMIKGFWDPYKSYIEIEVEVDATEYGYGKALQVDNSASSFISEMTVFVDSKQVQRIQQYDTVAAILHDVNYTPADKFGQEYEGHGYNNYTSEGINIDQRTNMQSNLNGTALLGGVTAITGVNSGVTRAATANTNAIRGWQPQYPQYVNCDTPQYGVPEQFFTAASNNTMITPTLSALTPDTQLIWPRTVQTQNTGVASTYVHAMTTGIAIYNDVGKGNLGVDYRADNQQLTTAFPNQRNIVSPRPFIQSVQQSSTYGVQGTNALNFSLSNPQPFVSSSIAGAFSSNQSFTLAPGYKAQASVANTGYTSAWSQQLSNSSSEPVFAPAHGTSWITDGQFLPTPLASNKKIFQIPIISSILGVLIPIQSYKLLPMEAFKNLLLEFRLNEYAMFTSGYNQDFLQSTSDRCGISMNNYSQLKRNWKINRFELYGAIFSFDDFVTSMMRQQLQAEGLVLTSCGWALGPQFSIPTTMAIQNSWQINAGYESLQQLVFRIGCDDYQQYSFCRKHYYLSGNIQSLQLKIANTYIPPQPIIGHAGNIIPYGNQRNNAPFIIELHSAFGQLFNIGQNTYINATNFAVNDRPFNPTNTLSYANSVTGAVQNIDTAAGLPLFHQNRCVGRALYAFDLESLPGQRSTISGLNTLKYRPFEVQIDVDGENQFTRDSTLYFFLCYDVIYKLSMDNPPEVYGRGG